MMVVALTAAGSTAAADSPRDRCVIVGSDISLQDVTVPLPQYPFEVHLRGVPATAVVNGSVVEIEVSAAIKFKGVVNHKVWYTVRTPIVAGQITLARGAQVVGDRADSDELTGSAALEAGDVLPGENKQPDLEVSPVHVPCHQLSLDSLEEDGEAHSVAGQRYWYVRRGGSVVLRAEPSDRVPGVTVTRPSCTGAHCLRLAHVARRGAWLKLSADWSGVTVVGWARQQGFMPVPETDLISYGLSCSGHHGYGEAVHVFYMGAKQPTRLSLRIKVGTPVYAEPDGKVPWATVHRDDAVFTIDYIEGEQFGRVVDIPGVVLGQDSAYVPMSAVIFAS
jgi:hypothetical protein